MAILSALSPPVSYHCYADDSQLYLSLSPENHSTLDSLHGCPVAINDWMALIVLQLNTDETEVVLIVVQSCFLQIQNIAKIKPILSRSIVEQLIHTLIFSRLLQLPVYLPW